VTASSLFATLLRQAGPASPWPDGLGVARALVALVAVFGLLVGLLWLLRRGHLGGLARRRPGTIAVETAVPLGERRSLVVVAVEGRRLLLGVAPGQVSLLTELRGGPDFPAALDRQLDGRGGVA
jgi:flagellar biosynthetic protein FliO